MDGSQSCSLITHRMSELEGTLEISEPNAPVHREGNGTGCTLGTVEAHILEWVVAGFGCSSDVIYDDNGLGARGRHPDGIQC